MSQENVEILRAALSAFNRRDGEGFGAILAEESGTHLNRLLSGVSRSNGINLIPNAAYDFEQL